ncbi:DUF4199 domain-containing protein [Ilumatobacter coccineus]|uniref:Uncharacterized protein n=1 Tax=Ilumatobacter coccineus (strain NBRC 103263 / KCTC 29153 / YM16-304) TaxID=1313172 RepID=A0A6C7E915_ILUCY|nr:DUF4199 domain-containing protein [Ilumatobacter coccineus]BAN01699.1 hypothetical protein YM304_13850 [Ilumatobacter coccineus YM16-304]
MNDEHEALIVTGDVDDPHAGVDEPLLFDRIDALRVLRASSNEEKGALLEEIGGSGKVEQEIVDQLSKVKPLWQPDEFPEAHRMAMRSLEVLDRNGSRNAKLPPMGPLKPIAQYIVQQLTRWIVKGYVNGLVTNLRKLYERREANSIWGSPAQVLLRRARINAEQVEQGFKGNPVGVPTFLLGGAILSTILSTIVSLISAALDTTLGVVIAGVVVVLLLGSLSWAALYAAAVARRRIRLTTDQPIQALYDTIGAAGDPPRDQSYNFAVIAIVLLVLAVVVIPPLAYLVYDNATS